MEYPRYPIGTRIKINSPFFNPQHHGMLGEIVGHGIHQQDHKILFDVDIGKAADPLTLAYLIDINDFNEDKL